MQIRKTSHAKASKQILLLTNTANIQASTPNYAHLHIHLLPLFSHKMCQKKLHAYNKINTIIFMHKQMRLAEAYSAGITRRYQRNHKVQNIRITSETKLEISGHVVQRF